MHRTHPVTLRAVPSPATSSRGSRLPLSAAWLTNPAPSRALAALVALIAAFAAACSGNHHPAIAPTPAPAASGFERGMASWYGPKFHGHRTASGERYDKRAMTAAHPSLPFGTLVQVTNVENGRQVVVRINDRGPFAKRRIIDLSYTAARELGVVGPGTAEVQLAVLGTGEAMPQIDRNPVVVASLPEGANGTGAVLAVSHGPVAAPEALHFTVQVGAFSERDRADALQDDLIRTYPQTTVSSDGTWNRVQLGNFDSRDQAEVLCLELSGQGIPAIVVTTQ